MNIYSNFVIKCEERKLDVKVSRFRYLEMREEYLSKVNWWQEVQKCIDWCYDHEKNMITTNRLRNWMNNSIRFGKDKERKNIESLSEKKSNKMAGRKKPKLEKLWQPPV